MSDKIKKFWKKYETKIVLILAFVLVSGLAFEAGILKGQKGGSEPLIIEKTAECQNMPVAPEAQNLAREAVSGSASSDIPSSNCAFVGSKNSNLYHLPDSSYAKRINPENQICFSSAEDAAAKGYKPDKALSK